MELPLNNFFAFLLTLQKHFMKPEMASNVVKGFQRREGPQCTKFSIETYCLCTYNIYIILII